MTNYNEHVKIICDNYIKDKSINCWNFAKLSEQEKNACIRALKQCEAIVVWNIKNINEDDLKVILHASYSSFLVGVGYTGTNWRSI